MAPGSAADPATAPGARGALPIGRCHHQSAGAAGSPRKRATLAVTHIQPHRVTVTSQITGARGRRGASSGHQAAWIVHATSSAVPSTTRSTWQVLPMRQRPRGSHCSARSHGGAQLPRSPAARRAASTTTYPSIAAGKQAPRRKPISTTAPHRLGQSPISSPPEQLRGGQQPAERRQSRSVRGGQRVGHG